LPAFTEISNTGYYPAYRTQIFLVSGTMQVGAVFSLTVFSVTVTYTVQAGDNAFNVASGLINNINNTSSSTWNDAGSAPIGDPYFPPYAYTSGTSESVALDLNWGNQFSGSVSV
jgi:hypothetical protein